MVLAYVTFIHQPLLSSITLHDRFMFLSKPPTLGFTGPVFGSICIALLSLAFEDTNVASTNPDHFTSFVLTP